MHVEKKNCTTESKKKLIAKGSANKNAKHLFFLNKIDWYHEIHSSILELPVWTAPEKMRIDFHIAAVSAMLAPGSLKIHGGVASMNLKSRPGPWVPRRRKHLAAATRIFGPCHITRRLHTCSILKATAAGWMSARVCLYIYLYYAALALLNQRSSAGGRAAFTPSCPTWQRPNPATDSAHTHVRSPRSIH